MTNKEALNNLGGYCEYYIQELQDNLCSGDSGEEIKETQKEIDEAFDTLQKAVEILEILKEVIKNNVFDVAMLDDRPNGETLLSCDDFGIKLKTEDYWKIVGWVRQ